MELIPILQKLLIGLLLTLVIALVGSLISKKSHKSRGKENMSPYTGMGHTPGTFLYRDRL